MRLWPQRRAWRIALALMLATLAVIAALGLWAWWQLRDPQRLLRLGLDALESRSGLRLESRGTPNYALRPGITLQVPALTIRDPQDGSPIATLESLDLALPWDTARGRDTRLDRLAIGRATVDVVALQRWLDRQPEATALPTLPTLPAGLGIGELVLTGDGWSLRSRPATLGPFHPAEATTLALSGEITVGGRRGPFALTAALRLQPEGPAYGVQLGDVDLRGNTWLPGFRGALELPARGEVLARADGTVPAWPADWPALPPPLQDRDQPVSLHGLVARERYATHLRLQRQGLTVDTTLEPQAVRDWWNDGQPQAWLPPAAASRVEADKLVIDGVELEGVEFTLGDGAAEPADGR